MMQSVDDVLDFWFVEHGQKEWFGGGPEFDRKLAGRFAETHEAVARGEAWTWRATPEGRLAEIIVLDQFSRQIHRGSPLAFASDDMALEPVRRRFMYMPYMHSESLLVHEEAMRLFTALGDAEMLKYEGLHAACLRRFGRYPSRNAVLGRESTPEELDYIAGDEDRS
jgi:uncharacterized protein (DUF924 family)